MAYLRTYHRHNDDDLNYHERRKARNSFVNRVCESCGYSVQICCQYGTCEASTRFELYYTEWLHIGPYDKIETAEKEAKNLMIRGGFESIETIEIRSAKDHNAVVKVIDRAAAEASFQEWQKTLGRN